MGERDRMDRHESQKHVLMPRKVLVNDATTQASKGIPVRVHTQPEPYEGRCVSAKLQLCQPSMAFIFWW